MRRFRDAMRVVLLVTSFAILLAAKTGHGSWLTTVPEKARARQNPYADDFNATIAGAKLFDQHCAQCHGADADGRAKKPSLRTRRIERATPGELEWLLTNGSLVKGMPSWSRLPEPQRWQLVTYLKTLR